MTHSWRGGYSHWKVVRGCFFLFSGQSAFPCLPIYHRCAAHCPPFQFLEKFCIFSLIFGQISVFKTQIFPIFVLPRSLFKENLLPRTYFWKPLWGIHPPKKKKLSVPRHILPWLTVMCTSFKTVWNVSISTVLGSRPFHINADLCSHIERPITYWFANIKFQNYSEFSENAAIYHLTPMGW